MSKTEKISRDGYHVWYQEDSRTPTQLSADCAVYVHHDDSQLPHYLQMTDEDLEAVKTQSLLNEDAITNEIKKRFQEWADNAYVLKMCEEAAEYKTLRQAPHSNNQWVSLPYNSGEEISNTVYRMNIRIDEDSTYDMASKESKVIAWYVSWWFSLNLLDIDPAKYLKIAGQNRKKFASKADAEKYIAGRKKAYSKYFMEENPEIPQEYADRFTYRGMIRPGYRVAKS